MRKLFFIIPLLVLISIIIFLFSTGFFQKECEIASDCANKACFTADCKDNNCTYSAISDCCGNEICEVGENYSKCVADCPNCDDGNSLTMDSFNYETQKCENVVMHYIIDDFEGTLQNWNFGDNPDWKIEIEGNNTVLRGTTHYGAITSIGKWDNYIFKFRFKPINGSLLAFFRFDLIDSSMKGYIINLEEGTKIELLKIGPNITITTASLKDVQFSFDKNWHAVEIRSYNDVINVFMDDELLIKYKDTNPVLSGRVGFRNSGLGGPRNSESLVDDVEIKSITETDITYP